MVVFIHGGAFIEGGSRLYYPNLFLDRDVVLVTFNYRLGSLGILLFNVIYRIYLNNSQKLIIQ